MTECLRRLPNEEVAQEVEQIGAQSIHPQDTI